MGNGKTLYQKIKDCDENKLFSIFVKLFDGNFINMNMINKAYSEHVKHSKRSLIVNRIESGEQLFYCYELQDLFGLRPESIHKIFDVTNGGQVNIDEHKIFFMKPFNLYKTDIFDSSLNLCLLCDSLDIINNEIKNKQLILSKTKFYLYKERILKKLYNLGFLRDFHKEKRGEETFYSLHFVIGSNDYYFHQKTGGFFDILPNVEDEIIMDFRRFNKTDYCITYNEEQLNELCRLIRYCNDKYLIYD